MEAVVQQSSREKRRPSIASMAFKGEKGESSSAVLPVEVEEEEK